MSGAREMANAIKDAIWSELCNVHTALPGVVNKYDPTGPSVEVMPLIKKQYLDGQTLSFQPIAEVPVVFPRTNRFHLSFPIERGDTGLILFSERSLSDWLTGSGGEVVQNRRKFALTDAIFIPGLFAFKKGNQIISGSDFELAFDDVKIVSNGKSFEFTGDLKINGKIEATDDVLTNSISLKGHTHGAGDPLFGGLKDGQSLPVTGSTGDPE